MTKIEGSFLKMLLRSRSLLFGIALLLLATPLWTPYVQEINGRSLFVQADGLVMLGISLLFGLGSLAVLPNRILTVPEQTSPAS